ncbi:MAG TPA: hypothetical protein VMT86_11365 [Bryobacteraceae bacterium]|nr:hypothetical protein [Bryobacteraceae bacterium]
MTLLRHPSAWLPIGMSLAGLALVAGHAAVYRIVHEADEGAAAHIFQLLMAGQLPILGYFAVRWLPQAPGQAARVMALQAVAVGAALASVYWLT